MSNHWTFDDGGRAAAGFKGDAGDCATRAAAIVTGIPYREVYDAINGIAEKHERQKKRGRSNARTGVFKTTLRRFMESRGWRFVPTMQIGSGCKVHLRADELPSGRILCNVSKHYVAVVDGVIHDTFDPSRGGRRCVYGYFVSGAA
jgi:hypothetical protein